MQQHGGQGAVMRARDERWKLEEEKNLFDLTKHMRRQDKALQRAIEFTAVSAGELGSLGPNLFSESSEGSRCIQGVDVHVN